MDDAMSGAPRGAFFDGNEARQAAEALLKHVEEFRRRVGQSALSVSAQEGLLPVIDQTLAEVMHVQGDVAALEVKELFGNDESYWNVFRLLCREQNAGKVFSLDQIWRHLSLTFDMGSESLDSLAQTIDEWSGDIIEDARTKYHIAGELREVGSGFAFIPLQFLRPKAAPRPRPRAAVRQQPAVVELVPVVVEQHPVDIDGIFVLNVLAEMIEGSDGFVRQPDLVRSVMARLDEVPREDIVDCINGLAAEGSLYKYKSATSSVARLTLNAEIAHAQSAERAEHDRDSHEKAAGRENVFDMKLAQSIIVYLIHNVKYAEQMTATSTIYRHLSGALPDMDERAMKSMIRFLDTLGVLATDTGTPLRGKGKARSRAKSRVVFRTGFASQQVKDELKACLEQGLLGEYLQRLIQQPRTLE